MLDLSVKDFIERTSSSSPTPGGGSIAALVASLAVALSSMVASLTVGKKNYLDVEEDMKRYLTELDILQKETQEFIRLDIEAFDYVMAQYSLPKDTDEEKAHRSAMIQEATIKAANVPLNLAYKIYELYNFAEELMKKGNKNVYSDALISMLLCHSAIEASLCNVVVNKNSIKNLEIKEELNNKINSLLELSNKRKNELMSLSKYFE